MLDWKSLSAVENRIVSNADDTDLLTCRLQRMLAKEQQQHDENNGSNDESSLISLDEIKHIMSPGACLNCAWRDIPRLELGEYRDDELTLWHAILTDYCGTLLKVPKYTSTMIWSGIPPPLRGRVWKTLVGIDSVELDTLESLYNDLVSEWTPSVKIIGRDLNRTFPEISLFREKDGVGQQMLGRVMRAYSAYDIQVGYCQGLTFLAGPLLLHMDDTDAFCVMVKLMEDYDLRSMFTADMAGLHLRVYQLERLIEEHLPRLYQHFNDLEINMICTSQWFLSLFAVTCPLDMLVRIYDVIFAEGAIVTLMRTAIAVLKRNEADLLDFEDEEDVQCRLLSSSLWDVFGYDADTLMGDIRAVPGHEILRGLEQAKISYEEKTSSSNLARKASSKRRTLTSMRRSSRYRNIRLSLHRPALTVLPVPDVEQVSASSSAHSTTANISPSVQEEKDDEKLARDIDTTLSLSPSSTLASSLSSPSLPPQTQRRKSSITFMSDLSRSGSCSSSISGYATSATSYEGELDELVRTKSNLESERKERQVDRELIATLLGALPLNFFEENREVSSVVAQLRSRFRLEDAHGNVDTPSFDCKNCERLMMDLGAAKSREATLRVKLDELQDMMMHQGIADLDDGTKRLDGATYSVAGKQKWGFWR